MKKVFVSQPMNKVSNENIKLHRELALICAKNLLGDDVVDVYPFTEVELVKNPLYMLGESIKHMSEADVVYFVNGWETSRGCQIEHECAIKYGMYIVKE